MVGIKVVKGVWCVWFLGLISIRFNIVFKISTEDDRMGAILGDLSKRRSQIIDIGAVQDTKTIIARTPLSQMVGYSTTLRTLTSGTANFTMDISDYEQVDPAEQERIFLKLRGY